jgi:hypothetical protein
MHYRPRSRLPMQILSIMVIITLVIPPSLVVAAPLPAEAQSLAPVEEPAAATEWSPASLFTSAGAWLSQAFQSAVAWLDTIGLAPTPADSPLPTPPEGGREVPSAQGPPPWVMRNPSAAHRNATIGPKGGRMATPDNAVQIEFPPNASPRARELRLETSATKSRVPEDSLRFTWLYFSLEPESVGTGAGKHLTFEHPVDAAGSGSRT